MRTYFVTLLLLSLLIDCTAPCDQRASAQDTNLSSIESLDPALVKDFEENVLPVLSQHCFSCHSHRREIHGNLTLDFASGWRTGGDRGPAIVPGKPRESLLLKAVRGELPELKMPPEESLSSEQIAALEKWIQMGAVDPRTTPKSKSESAPWWSHLPIHEAPAPDTIIPSGNAVDAFLRVRIEDAGLRVNPPADRRTLLRRLMIDLHGLVPTSEDMVSFEEDTSPDAYESWVDRLLASPRYGERWGRHWFDWIHYADTHGFEHDVMRTHAWPYRDYVVQSLNADTPWDRWIQEQLASDVLFPDRTDLLPALGFLAAGPWDQSTAATAKTTFDYLDRDAMITQISSVLLSSTVHCSRCHHHKFDPIPQEDYYAMQAALAGIGRGNVPYDLDLDVAMRRREAKQLLHAVKSRDKSQLLNSGLQNEVAAWERDLDEGQVSWEPLREDLILTTDGTEIQVLEDGILQASGPKPATETYIIKGRTDLDIVTGIRLEVLRDGSLPQGGPGRNDNGNFHLSELVVELLADGSSTTSPIPISKALSDFDQTSWTISHAIDGNVKTAWGIFPQVGQNHTAVFQFEKPVRLRPADRIIVRLRQLHGGSHTIGRFRLSISSNPNLQRALIPREVQAALSVHRDRRTEEEKLVLAAYVGDHKATSLLDALPKPAYVYAAAPYFEALPDSGFYTPWSTPKKVFVLKRGDIDKPTAEATPGALTCMTHGPSRFDTATIQSDALRRVELSKWITHRDNPLFWRSIVNRLWQHHFGRGIVDTPNDFGRMGSRPSHPELLDWLANELRRSGGSLKQIQRLMVTSAAYQRSSNSEPLQRSIDPENRLLGRGPSGRLDAETYRDSLIHLAGTLDYQAGGPGVQWFKLGPGNQLTPKVEYSQFDWTQKSAHRRSIYRLVYRGLQDPFMEALDFPDAAQLAPARSPTASPLQALALWNHDFVLQASTELAARCRRERDYEPIDVAFRLIFLRSPTSQEWLEASQYVEQNDLSALLRVMINSNEFLTFR